jgi:hypothetical protein
MNDRTKSEFLTPVAFDRWHAEASRDDVIDRVPAMRGWFAGREYQNAVNALEISNLRWQVAQLRKELE